MIIVEHGLRRRRRDVEIDFVFAIEITLIFQRRHAIADVIEFVVDVARRDARAYAMRLFDRRYAIAKILVQNHIAARPAIRCVAIAAVVTLFA